MGLLDDLNRALRERPKDLGDLQNLSVPQTASVLEPDLSSSVKQLNQSVRLLRQEVFKMQQSRLFESLVPAFAEAPIKRVFPLVIFVLDHELKPCRELIRPLKDVLGAEFLGDFAELYGSALFRSIYETSRHQTLDGFQASQRALAEELIVILRESQVQNITVNIYPAAAKAEPKEWAGKFKDISEALKNLLLVGAGCTILLGGTVLSSKRETSEKPPSVTVKQIAPNDQLELLPKILEANTPEDFDKAISQVSPVATPDERPKRKFR